MISKAIYNVAHAQSQGLKAAINKKVMPGSKSLLNALINMSFVSASPEDVAVQIEEVTTGAPGQVTGHTAALGAIIDELSTAVQAHVEYVQNTVRPQVTRMMDELHNFRKENEAQGPGSLFDIQVVMPPPSMSNDSIRSMIDNMAQEGMQEPMRVMTLPAATYEQIVEWMSVSSASANKEIQEWLATRGQDWLMNIYAYFFASSNMTTTKPNVYRGGLAEINAMPAFTRVELGTAIFLISRGLYNITLDEPTGMNLNQWKQVMDSYSRYAALTFKYASKVVDVYERNKTLIMSVLEQGKVGVVYGPVYNAWLAEGNDAATILGAMISGKSTSFTVQDIDNADVDFCDIWSNYEKTAEATLRARLDISMRAHALGVLQGMCGKLSPAESELFGEDNTSVFNNMVTEAKNWLSDIPTDTALDAEKVALKLVAGIRYKHTPAFQFLGDMLELGRQGVQDPREAAAIASINYISDYLSTELALTQA